MKTTIRLLFLFVMVMTAFGQHTAVSAAATGISRNHWNFNSTFARFVSVDASGCIETYVRIEVNEAWNTVDVSIHKYDTCTYTTLIWGSGQTDLDNSDFQVLRRRALATLKTTVNIQAFWGEGEPFDVSVDVTWTAAGPLSRWSSSARVQNPDCLLTDKGHISWREAVATGTVSDGETNFTPVPSQYGNISWSKGISKLKGSAACEDLLFSEDLNQIVPLEVAKRQIFETAFVGTWFSLSDPSGCIFTHGIVYVNNVSVDPGQGHATPFLTVGIYQSDYCTDTPLMGISASHIPLDDRDFKLSGNSAELNTTITVDDYIRNISFEILIDLTWQASGPLTKEDETIRWRNSECHKNIIRQSRDWREAEVSGTLSDGQTNFVSYSYLSQIGRTEYVTEACE